MKLITITATFLFALNAQSITINCFETDKFDALCSGVIDRAKVEYVNCLDGKPKNSYETKLCSNLNIGTDSELDDETGVLNCLDGSITETDYYLHQICSAIPLKESIEKIDCLGEIENGYQNSQCESVDTVQQEWIKKVLWFSNQHLNEKTSAKPSLEISCVGDENGDLGDAFESSWCESQISSEHSSCEEAAVKGLESFFNLKFVKAEDVRVVNVVKIDAEYTLGYSMGPFEVLYTKKVVVSKKEGTCFTTEIK